jgi:hypothetical protein
MISLPNPEPSPLPTRRQVVLLGTRVALAFPDCRSARTENQVLALDTHMSMIVKVDVSDLVGDLTLQCNHHTYSCNIGP